MLLGTVTDTQDSSGEVLEKKDTASLTVEEVTACIQKFVGNYEQVPPMYSALKVGGKAL